MPLGDWNLESGRRETDRQTDRFLLDSLCLYVCVCVCVVKTLVLLLIGFFVDVERRF